MNKSSESSFEEVNESFVKNIIEDIWWGENSRINQLLLADICESDDAQEIIKATTASFENMDVLLREFSNDDLFLKILCIQGFVGNSIKFFLSSNIEKADSILYDFTWGLAWFIKDQNGNIQIRWSYTIPEVGSIESTGYKETLDQFQTLLMSILKYNDVDFTDGIK